MQLPILIEPIDGGRFRARSGEPLALMTEGATAHEALTALQAALREQLRSGARLGAVDVENGSVSAPAGPLQLDPLPEDDWFFQTMREAIEENRRREDQGG